MATIATTAGRNAAPHKAQEPAKPFFEPSIVDEHGKLDHHRAPFIEAISAYRGQNMTPFSTPGHKLGRGMDRELVALYGPDAFACDIPVSGGADAIHFNFETWRLAEELGADAWNADRTFYLVNGSSTGNLAFLTALIRPGDKVIVARDVHKSMMVALIQSGARPVYIAPALHPTLDIGLGVEAHDVEETIRKHPDAKMVILVSPSYCGVSSDLSAIAGVAHAHDIPVYVDEAWGPHFHFHTALPQSAMDSGVDGAVASTHKVLGAFTQSAVLHIKGPRVNPGRVAATVGMAQTTSPASFILATIDGCRRQMVNHGRELLDVAIELAEDARARLKQIPGVSVLDGETLGVAAYDLTKLVIDVHGLGLTGFQVEDELRYRYQINPEMSDLTSIVCLVTVGDTQASIERLVTAFESISHGQNGSRKKEAQSTMRSSGSVIAPGIQAMSPRDAFYSHQRAIPLEQAAGEISAELVIPYPPGIPVLAPGDVITVEKLEYLKFGAASGMYISGAADHQLRTIQVVDEPKQGAWTQQPYYSNLSSR
ncbi:MAG: aminotransferase class I/II-fold pyridoxal phosphate-dependent enzyme [Thermomicrobiales bacterium]|nr:aminotransferase class I/II-fold pyridoxal phosphate-dependent enzyme [Thermomicrobiales bacterium]